VPFTIGLGAWEGPDFRVRQLVLADHADEPALLALLAEEVPLDACLVTYNGKAFDWPLLVARFRLLGHPPPPLGQHLDLLPLARQIWKHRLPDARLASVEAGVAGVRRPHDLPGAFIPARYLHYLRSGHGSLLREVLEHNRQDVLSLALLLRSLAEDLLPMAGTLGATPMALVSSVEPSDLCGLGRIFARRRRHTEALACFEVAMEALVTPWDAGPYEAVAVERARTLTRLGRRAEAEGAWHAIALEGGRLAALAWVQVAKHREHDAGDIVAALEATRRARAIADRARLFGRRDRLVERDLARRVTRLRRRLGATDRRAGA
jgi:tetratricopeptide (TPR) repeat protein